MKSALVCAVLLIHASRLTGGMSRVIEVRDSRTIVVQSEGVAAVIALREVMVPSVEEAVAVAYLRRSLEGRWVYVENGDVYRSPDGLYVNGAMRRRAWLGATYLGELAFPAPRRSMTHVLGNVSQAAPPPAKRAKAASRHRARPRSPAKRPSKAQ
jgi:hypothetical protein